MGGGYVSELRRPLEHRVPPPSLTKREPEAQKEGSTGPLSHSTWVSEEKRPGNPSETPASRLSKSCADTSNCLGPTGPLLPKTPTTSISPQAPPHQSVGWCPLGPSITNSSPKQVHTWVQACTHTYLSAGRALPLQSPRPACLLCWAGEQEGAVKGKKTERWQGGKHSKAAQLGWVWSRPLSPAHNSQESCPIHTFLEA